MDCSGKNMPEMTYVQCWFADLYLMGSWR